MTLNLTIMPNASKRKNGMKGNKINLYPMPMKNQNMRKHADPVEVGRTCHEIARLGFSAVHWRLFFGTMPSFENGKIQLTVSERFDNMKGEILFIDGKRITPLETYFEWGVTDIVMPDRKVYIFQSPLDGLAFFQMKKMAESRSEEHTSELQSRENLVCRLLLEKT